MTSGFHPERKTNFTIWREKSSITHHINKSENPSFIFSTNTEENFRNLTSIPDLKKKKNLDKLWLELP